MSTNSRLKLMKLRRVPILALDSLDGHSSKEIAVSLPASFYVWLASPEARFLKGKFLWANWDVDELGAKAKEIEAGSYLPIGLVGWPFQQGDWELQGKFLRLRHNFISVVFLN
jgi:hypothetical protein